jgi:type II secretory pathway component PulJ
VIYNKADERSNLHEPQNIKLELLFSLKRLRQVPECGKRKQECIQIVHRLWFNGLAVRNSNAVRFHFTSKQLYHVWAVLPAIRPHGGRPQAKLPQKKKKK